MAQINIAITLDNIDPGIDAHQLADTIEGIVRQISGMETSTVIYDNDGTNSSNPIMAQNTLRRIR